MLYGGLIRPALFQMDPERAHRLALKALRLLGASQRFATTFRRSALGLGGDPIEVLGLNFDHRLGLAAGFDKDGRGLWGLYALGFGFVEVGSVSARPWPGNAAPRIFRVPERRALINRMGLPSEGAQAVARRLKHRPPLPVFVNVAKTGDPSLSGEAAIADICCAVAILASVADVLVLNLSCPNTPDGQTFQEPSALKDLLRAVLPYCGDTPPPILVKVSPDTPFGSLDALATTAMREGARGFVATNTTLERTDLGPPPPGGWPAGGLSGPPLRERALAVVRRLRETAGPDAVIVGCGGVETNEDYRRFREAGADLVEAYSGFVYGGPFFCSRVLHTSS